MKYRVKKERVKFCVATSGNNGVKQKRNTGSTLTNRDVFYCNNVGKGAACIPQSHSKHFYSTTTFWLLTAPPVVCICMR